MSVRRDLHHALLDQKADALLVERPAGDAGVALGVDPFGEPQTHQEELVGPLLACQYFVRDETVAEGFDALQPNLRPLFGGERVAAAVNFEPGMGAGTDAG